MKGSVDEAIARLVYYGLERGLIEKGDRVWATNAILSVLKLQSFTEPKEKPEALPLEDILGALLNDAVSRGLTEDKAADRDRLDTALMGVLTPRPSWVAERFQALCAQSPKEATDWYYSFSQSTDYIRSYRVARDIKWKCSTEYGELDITINLSKPEKDPRDIAAAGRSQGGAYPLCQLCREAEGYAGREDYPPRQNHRLIPLRLAGEPWFFQYSPYVYYNEHCIVLNRRHIPMRIDRAALAKLLEFTGQFPHYFLGSNADLPIVGGSILSHDHFQGGRYSFAMERASVERELSFPGFEDVAAGTVRWPMSVIRLRAVEPQRLEALGDRILTAWRGYSDAQVGIFAETRSEAHNTVTPIARRRGEDYELDLVLRNNICTEQYPLGVFHPHEELHHIKKENIGLIEVMGLAILPPRLNRELTELAELLCSGGDLYASETTAKHAKWAERLRAHYDFNQGNVTAILQREVGLVYKTVLEQAGVFKRDEAGQEAFMRFVDSLR